MENKPSGGRFIAALLFFATTAGIAILLLLTALVIWLSSVTGSFIASALIAGGFFAVLALLVYLFAIRDAVEQIRRQAETVYEVAHAAQTGYEWLAGKVSLFLKLREGKHSVNHVFSSPTSIINFTSKKPSYDDTRRSGRDNELLQRAQNDL